MSEEKLQPLQLIAREAQLLDADCSPLSIALSEVLLRRRSSREFGAGELSLYRLSRLLWAAFGINRPEQGLRTAPSVGNKQDIEIYVALPAGLYRFDARELTLQPVVARDLRAASGGQEYVARAPLDLIYVAKVDDDHDGPRVEQQFFAALDTGFISQNVYLFCAAEGLSTVVRCWIDRAELAALMGLPSNRLVIAAQSVGYPPQWPPRDPALWAPEDD
ncbi:SagB/ThcOx family dehydrogenase [Duganella callida]|uniref:SagB/ThcOx family dehydrogenase n=1 Tax=Duganella callida TaxID=2561932 RepID=A0A4Y9SLY7_9BURK|nr:SagB/ThcOx family dehydrogenase [Duganella callida]TFW23128.1 SagB/ThcOx family dehydrogenase [Duganella callida]